MIRRARLIVGLALGLLPAALAAQGLTEVDRIVAVVGRTAIPASRVDEEVNMRRQRGDPVPADSAPLAQLRREIVDQLVDDELLVQQAQEDTMIHVSDEQVQGSVNDAIRQVRSQFRSDVDFERQILASGFGSMEEYRRWITDQRRRELLQQTLTQKLRQKGDIRPLPPTEDELRGFYERVKDRQTRPAVVSFRQVLTRPEPDSAALAAALRLADSLSLALRNGADFATLAKRFSDDPGSRDQGGELGYFRRGQMVPEFEYAAFRLRPGQISPPVRSSYGFHVIQVQRSDPAEVQARQILIAPKVTDANVVTARARADTVAQVARAGASFDSLARVYHDPSEQAFAEGVVIDSLPLAYRGAVAAAQPGSVLGPIAIERPDGSVRFSVIKVEEIRPAGSYTYEELKERIRTQLTESNSLRRYLDGLRQRTYIDIRL